MDKMRVLQEYVRRVLAELSHADLFEALDGLEVGDREALRDLAQSFNLAYVGTGAGRRVYDLGDGTVIKIATNVNGLQQNQNEVKVAEGIPSDAPINKPIASARDSKRVTWIVSPKVERIDGDELGRALKATVGFSDVDELQFVVDAGMDPRGAPKSYVNLHHKLHDTNEWYAALFDAMFKLNIVPFELHGDNWGLDANGDLVLLDLG